MKPMFKKIITAGLVSGAVMMGYHANVASAAETVRVASFLPERAMAVQAGMMPWIKGVKKEVGDEIEFKTFWGGALGPNPRKQLDMVINNVTDVATVITNLHPGRFPGSSIHELPLLANSSTEIGVAQWRLYDKGLLPGYDNVKLIGFFVAPPYQIHTKTPIKNANDLKGLKIRTSGPVASMTLKELGMVPVGLPVNQAAEALSRGVVDGASLSYAGLGIFKMDSIAKYHFEPTLGTVVIMSVMNKSKWESLPKNIQAAMDKYGGERMAKVGTGIMAKVNAKFEKKMRGSEDHKFVDAPDLKMGSQFFKPVYEQWIKDTPNGQKIFDEYVTTLETIRSEAKKSN